MAFALEDLDTDIDTKPELAVLAVNHDGTEVGSDYKIHFYTQGKSGQYMQSRGSSDPMRDVKLCGAVSCGKSPKCCTALTFAGQWGGPRVSGKRRRRDPAGTHQQTPRRPR